MSRVAAIVCNWDGARYLRQCVGSLRAQQGVKVRVIVVDNGSSDDSLAVAADLRVETVPLPRNRGLAAGYNAGARGAPEELLFFVNNDMHFAPDCVARLAAAFDTEPDLFAADPRHRSWDGARVTHGCLTLVRDPRTTSFTLPGLASREIVEMTGPRAIPWACGGAMLVSRDKFEALGGFDDTFFVYQEDVDLCLRAWRRGWGVVHVPTALVYHEVSASHGPKARPARLGVRSLRYYANEIRVKTSVLKNAQRVALKHYAPADIALLGAQTARALTRGVRDRRLLSPFLGLVALGWNLLETRRWLAERRRLGDDEVLSARDVLERFIDPTSRPDA